MEKEDGGSLKNLGWDKGTNVGKRINGLEYVESMGWLKLILERKITYNNNNNNNNNYYYYY